jgi:hypothetical protein
MQRGHRRADVIVLRIVVPALGSSNYIIHGDGRAVVNIPVLIGVAGVIIGSALLLLCARKF